MGLNEDEYLLDLMGSAKSHGQTGERVFKHKVWAISLYGDEECKKQEPKGEWFDETGELECRASMLCHDPRCATTIEDARCAFIQLLYCHALLIPRFVSVGLSSMGTSCLCSLHVLTFLSCTEYQCPCPWCLTSVASCSMDEVSRDDGDHTWHPHRHP